MLGGGLGRRVRERALPRRGSAFGRWLRGYGRLGYLLDVRWLDAAWLRGRRRRRRCWWVAGALLAAVIGIVTWVVWPSPAPEPRARQYRDVTACLLTDERGIIGPQAAAVWAGMQDASLATLAKVQYLEVDGAQTADNAQTYLVSLVQGRCDLILAVGEAPLGALARIASRYPSVRFVAVGGVSASSNVSVLEETAPDAVQSRVSSVVLEALGHRSSR